MTIASKTAKIIHVASLNVREYPFPFKTFNAEEIEVLRLNPKTRKEFFFVLDSDYLVSGLNLDGGGKIYFTDLGFSKLIEGQSLVIKRAMDFTQKISYAPHGTFPAETHEKALDILTMQIQQLKEKLKLAVLAPEDELNPLTALEIVSLEENVLEALAKTEVNKKEIEKYKVEAEFLFESMKIEAEKAKQEADRAEEITLLDLPIASKNVKGLVKIGPNLNVEEGLISLPIATKNVLGGIKVGANLNVVNGVLNAENSFILPNASENVLGAVKVGKGLQIESDGTLNFDFKNGGGTNVFQESGTFTVPYTGLYQITLIGGGGGGGASYNALKLVSAATQGYGGGGGAGETLVFDLNLTKGNLLNFTIGQGGLGGIAAEFYEDGTRAGNGENTILIYESLTFGAHGGGAGGPHSNVDENVSLPPEVINLPVYSGLQYKDKVLTGGGAGGVSYYYNKITKKYIPYLYASTSGIYTNLLSAIKGDGDGGYTGNPSHSNFGKGGGKYGLSGNFFGVGGNGGNWLASKNGEQGQSGAILFSLKIATDI